VNRGRRRGRTSPIAKFAAALALVVPLAGACRPSPPPGDVALLPLATPLAQGEGAPPVVAWAGQRGERRLSTADRVRLTWDGSERLAVLTGAGAVWEAPVELAPGDRLELTVAAGHGRPPHGTVSVLSDDGEVTLADVAAEAAAGWTRQAIDVERHLAGRLWLASHGPRPLAWSEVFVVRGGGGAATPPARPNLILVSIDTLRADHLSPYGADPAISPRLDAFAADALVFDRALSTSTWTLPSHGSMLTGLLPAQHGLERVDDRLSRRAVTVAARLRRLGYRTAAFTDGGFLAPRWGLSRGFDRWDVTPGQAWQPKDVKAIVAGAGAWLKENRFRPFFLFVHTYETHQPYRDREGFGAGLLPPGTPPGDSVEVFELDAERIEPAELARVRGLYAAGVRRVDHHLGGWLADLAAAGALDDTAVVVTSDHGEELAEHGAFEHAHGRVWDECVRVPMIVRPAGGAAGRRSPVPVTTLDVAPTLLAWAGAADPRLPGRPLAELADEGDAGRPVYVTGIPSLPEDEARYQRLDVGPQVLVRTPGGSARFDLAADRGMQRRSRLDPASPVDAALVARLQAVLAWSEAARSVGGSLAARLPEAASGVRPAAGSAVAPTGGLSGLAWRPWSAERPRLDLDRRWPSLLLFDLLPGRREATMRLTGAGAADRLFTLQAGRERRDDGWQPMDGPLPPPGVPFAMAPRLASEHLVLTEEAERELRSLGYLR